MMAVPLQAQNGADALGPRLAHAFHQETVAGLRLATGALLVALIVIAIWLWAWVPPPRLYFHEIILVLFGAVAVANLVLVKRAAWASWVPFAAVLLHCALMAFSMVGYDLIFGDQWPPQMMLRRGTFIYFFIILAFAALSNNPLLVLTAGIGSACCWGVAAYLLVALPDTVLVTGEADDEMSSAHLAGQLNPRFVNLNVLIQDVVIILTVAGILAAGVRRSRQMVFRQAVAARERANLARHFSPRMVDRLAQSDGVLSEVRSQAVAVLFADIVGFTRLSEHEPAERVISLLRTFYLRLEHEVFEHQGTLDKFLGDGVMATFGTPDADPQDPANALACARAMLRSVDRWNQERKEKGETLIHLSIGVHHGRVMLGDIGSKRRLEYAVIGDVVNVASRLETLTRELSTRLLVSDDLIQALPDAARASSIMADLSPIACQPIRGRDQPILIWKLSETPASPRPAVNAYEAQPSAADLLEEQGRAKKL